MSCENENIPLLLRPQLEVEQKNGLVYPYVILLGAAITVDDDGTPYIPTIMPNERDGQDLYIGGSTRAYAAASMWHHGLCKEIIVTGGVSTHGRRDALLGGYLRKYGVPEDALNIVGGNTDSGNTEGNLLDALRFLAMKGPFERLGILSATWQLTRTRSVIQKYVPGILTLADQIDLLPDHSILTHLEPTYRHLRTADDELLDALHQRYLLEKQGILDLKAGIYKKGNGV